MTINDLKFGDIIIQRNLHRFYLNKGRKFHKYNENLTHKNNKELDIIKVQRYVDAFGTNTFHLVTLYKRKEEILDKEEKEYLNNVIRPFRNKVVHIMKDCGWGTEYISILLRGSEYLNLPYFKKGTMYKNIELNKEYTLEELGL